MGINLKTEGFCERTPTDPGNQATLPDLIPRMVASGHFLPRTETGRFFFGETNPETNLEKKTKSEVTDLLPNHVKWFQSHLPILSLLSNAIDLNLETLSSLKANRHLINYLLLLGFSSLLTISLPFQKMGKETHQKVAPNFKIIR